MGDDKSTKSKSSSPTTNPQKPIWILDTYHMGDHTRSCRPTWSCCKLQVGELKPKPGFEVEAGKLKNWKLQAPHVRALFWFTLAVGLFIDACAWAPCCVIWGRRWVARDSQLSIASASAGTTPTPSSRPPATSPFLRRNFSDPRSLSLFNLANLYTPSGNRSLVSCRKWLNAAQHSG